MEAVTALQRHKNVRTLNLTSDIRQERLIVICIVWLVQLEF